MLTNKLHSSDFTNIEKQEGSTQEESKEENKEECKEGEMISGFSEEGDFDSLENQEEKKEGEEKKLTGSDDANFLKSIFNNIMRKIKTRAE